MLARSLQPLVRALGPSALGLLLLSSALSAQTFLTGVVVDGSGNPVPGVNVDLKNSFTGDDATLLNDGTNAFGQFVTTIVDGPGVYDVFFKPPAPPTTSLLVGRVDQVAVVGTTDMGATALELGAALTCRLVAPGGIPVAGVDLDVVVEETGEKPLLSGETSNLFGVLVAAVPFGKLELTFDTQSVLTAVYAPQRRRFTAAADTDLGDIQLDPGFTVEGVVRTSLLVPVQGADFDAYDSLTGERVLTLNDNTDELGEFEVVLPAGQYDLELCPPAPFLAQEFPGVTVTGNVLVPPVTVQTGVQLSGQVSHVLGGPVGGIDVDVRTQSTGEGLPLCEDNSNGQGAYSVYVPPGVYKVIFSPPAGSLLAPVTVENVVVAAAATLDVVLSPARGGPGGVSPVAPPRKPGGAGSPAGPGSGPPPTAGGGSQGASGLEGQ